MNGDELLKLIAQRWETLNGLLALCKQQTNAIESGHMNELMQILSQKQQPLQRLSELADQLRPAVDDDPDSRHWANPSDRDRCRQQQEECDRMHMELLAIEAQCESSLQESRTNIQQEIEQLDSAHRAAKYYAPQTTATDTGGRLDLSE